MKARGVSELFMIWCLPVDPEHPNYEEYYKPGLQWESVGREKPDEGAELKNSVSLMADMVTRS